MLDISSYLKQIKDDADKPLFQEAVRCAKENAFRAAYVMIWISCAESLKRRFKEASKRDGNALIIYGEVERKEKLHKSVDKYLLDQAKSYGMLSDSAFTILFHIYELRCIYGHPYESSPTAEQVTHAASVVVTELLSHPVRLRHGFCESLLTSLLEEKNYLDNQQKAVESFTSETLPRIDEQVLGWFLLNYMKKLELIADDPSMKIFFWRGVWFCRTTLSIAGVNVFSKDEWHKYAVKYPKTLIQICKRSSLFIAIGKRARSTLVGKTLDMSSTNPTLLLILEKLSGKGALSDRLATIFTDHLLELADSPSGAKTIRASRLTTKTCYPAVIKALQSYHYYTQSPIVEFVVTNGASGVEELEEECQTELGRNILQTAQGNEGSARQFLISEGLHKWPQLFLKGILLECFTNENNELRFKTDRLNAVLHAIEQCDSEDCEKHSDAVVDSLKDATPKNDWFDEDDFDEVEKIVREYDWADRIVTELSRKKDSLFGNKSDSMVEEDN